MVSDEKGLNRDPSRSDGGTLTGERMAIDPAVASVAIVVVNYNGTEYTMACLESLLQIDHPRYRIVFVDNGSSENPERMVKALDPDRIETISLPLNLGVTGGNNAGIRYARDNGCTHVLFLNNDTTVEKRFLSTMLETSKAYNGALVVPKIICYYDQKRLDHYIGPDIDWWTSQPIGYRNYPLDTPDLNVRTEIGIASTCCLLVPLHVIDRVGTMDENYFMYQDDSDFTLRVKRAGYDIIYEPEAVIFHKCNMTTKNKQNSFFEFYLQNRNLFYFYNKLCNRPLLKYFFFFKKILSLVLRALKATVVGNAWKRRIMILILRDIFNGKMGAPPDFGALEKNWRQANRAV